MNESKLKEFLRLRTKQLQKLSETIGIEDSPASALCEILKGIVADMNECLK